MRPMRIPHADSAACVGRVAGTDALLQAGRCGRRAPPQADSGVCGVGPQMALVDVPDISFDLNFLGGDASAVPGLESWLNGLVYQNVIRCAGAPGPAAPHGCERVGAARRAARVCWTPLCSAARAAVMGLPASP